MLQNTVVNSIESNLCSTLQCLHFTFSALAKVEHKLVQNLQNSGLCQNEEEFHRNIEEWERSLEGLDRHRQELVGLGGIDAAKYSKTCVKWPLPKDQILVFKTNYDRLMQVKSIAECSKGSILQYFRPSLSYRLSLRSFVCLLFEWPFYAGFTVGENINFFL